MTACHPQIAQRKQRHQLRRVLGKAFVAHLGEAELALDEPCRGAENSRRRKTDAERRGGIPQPGRESARRGA